MEIGFELTLALSLAACQPSIPNTATAPPTETTKPRGDQLAYSADSEIRLISADATNPRVVATGIYPTWSPDGRHLAYVQRSRNVVVVDADNPGPPLQVTTEQDSPGFYWPLWSPDGQWLAVIISRSLGQRDLYLVDAESVLQGNPIAPMIQLNHPTKWVRTASWSPDSQSVVFTFNYGEYMPDGIGVASISSPGARGQELTDASGPSCHPDECPSNFSPAWSPDGQHIAFVSRRDGNDEIYVMNPEGGEVTRLTHNEVSDTWPVWAPDGSRLAFLSDRGGGFTV